MENTWTTQLPSSMSRITFNSYCILTCNNGLSVWDFQYVKTMYKCCAVSPTLFEDTSRNLTNIQSKRFKTYHGNMSEVLKTHQEIEQTVTLKYNLVVCLNFLFGTALTNGGHFLKNT